MTYYRLADPPKDIEEEAYPLAQEYLRQFGDDDEIPENGVYEYQYAHASERLKTYFDEIQQIRAEAEREGILIG